MHTASIWASSSQALQAQLTRCRFRSGINIQTGSVHYAVTRHSGSSAQEVRQNGISRPPAKRLKLPSNGVKGSSWESVSLYPEEWELCVNTQHLIHCCTSL